MKVNVNEGEGENEGSVEIVTAGEEPFVSVGSDVIVDSVKLLPDALPMFSGPHDTFVFVYEAVVCGATFFGATDEMVGGDGDATVLCTGVNDEADSVEYELFSELGYSSVNTPANEKNVKISPLPRVL